LQTQPSRLSVPVLAVVVPAGHSVQRSLRAREEKVPKGHWVGALLPTVLKKPGSVVVHSSPLLRSVAFEWVPEGHGRGAAAPRGQNDPPSHRWHTVAPKWRWYFPTSQLSQSALPASTEIVPGAHGVCATPPAGLENPGSAGVH